MPSLRKDLDLVLSAEARFPHDLGDGYAPFTVRPSAAVKITVLPWSPLILDEE